MGRCRYDVSTVGSVSAMPVHGLSVHARMMVGTDSSAACVATMLHKTIMQRQIRRNMCLKVFNCSNFRNFPNLQLECKGTTKNAHLQTKWRKVYFQRNFVCKINLSRIPNNFFRTYIKILRLLRFHSRNSVNLFQF
jgi:hypothetical protein